MDNKFKIGDTIWTIADKGRGFRICSFTVKSILQTAEGYYYSASSYVSWSDPAERDCYPSRESLIQRLSEPQEDETTD